MSEAGHGAVESDASGIGPIVYLVGMTVDSAPDTNQYGPFPKAVGHPVA